MTNLARRQFMKVSAGTIHAIQVARWCYALTLLREMRCD